MAMNNLYDLNSWSTLYREERLAEAGRLHLAQKIRASRGPRGLRLLGSAWRNTRASLGAASRPYDQAVGETVK
jgi:hypothetical protein